MTLKMYNWTMGLVSVTALAGWLAVIFYVDPETTGLFGQAAFFASLFCALSAFFILVLTKWQVDPEDEKKARKLAASFRRGILLALFVVAILILQSLRLLVWWDALLVVVAILLVELFFLSR